MTTITATSPSAGLDDLYEHGQLMTVNLSPRAHQRYEQALWYVWGRQDAGDDRTRGSRSGHYLSDDFGFAEFAALEAERYDRQHECMLSCISDQYRRFLDGLGA